MGRIETVGGHVIMPVKEAHLLLLRSIASTDVTDADVTEGKEQSENACAMPFAFSGI
jgi:hypothetical protein